MGRNEMGHLRVLGWNDNIVEYKWYATEKKSSFFHRRDEELKKQGRERAKQSMGLQFESRMKKLPRHCLLNYENLSLPPVGDHWKIRPFIWFLTCSFTFCSLRFSFYSSLTILFPFSCFYFSGLLSTMESMGFRSTL